MTKSKPTPVSSGVITRGRAMPTPAVASGVATLAAVPDTQIATSANTYHKSLTVKLDKDRYIALKDAGTRDSKSNQDIMVEALDLWLQARSPFHARPAGPPMLD